MGLELSSKTPCPTHFCYLLFILASEPNNASSALERAPYSAGHAANMTAKLCWLEMC